MLIINCDFYNPLSIELIFLHKLALLFFVNNVESNLKFGLQFWVHCVRCFFLLLQIELCQKVLRETSPEVSKLIFTLDLFLFFLVVITAIFIFG